MRVRAGPLALAAALLAGPAAAEEAPPTLYDVAGVAAGARLDLRAGPSADAAILGGLAADAERVEVVGLDPGGAWGRVNFGEATAWVAMRFLAPRTDVWPEAALPATLRCFGTEPFWSVRPDAGALRYGELDVPDAAFALLATLQPPGADSRRRIAIAEGPAGRLTLVVAPEACSDGMSDRAFGLRADLVVEGAAPPRLLGGCCSVAP